MPSLREEWSQRWRSHGDLQRIGSSCQLSSGQTLSQVPEPYSTHQLPDNWLPYGLSSCQQLPSCPSQRLPRCPSQRQLSQHQRLSGREFQSQLSVSSENSQLSDCSSCPSGSDSCPGGSSSCCSETAASDSRPELRRSNSSLLPYLPLVEIPREKGLRRCGSWFRIAARKCRKNILRRPTHECTIPESLRNQLRTIYVY